MFYSHAGMELLPLQIHSSIPSSFVSSKLKMSLRNNHCFNPHQSFIKTMNKNKKPPMASHILKGKREWTLEHKEEKQFLLKKEIIMKTKAKNAKYNAFISMSFIIHRKVHQK